MAPVLLPQVTKLTYGSKAMGIIRDILFTNKNGLMSHKAMDIYAQRALVLSSNVANVETPGYKAMEIKPFEKALKKAYDSAKGGIKLNTTNPKHMSGQSSLKNFQAQVQTSTAPGRVDGNNVNLDEQIVKMNQNKTMYDALITARGKRGKMTSNAMEG